MRIPFGVPEVVLVVWLAFAVFLVAWPASRIFRKAGYPPWLGVGAMIPGLNVVLLFLLAFSTWPIERQLASVLGPAAPGAAPGPSEPR